MITRIEIDGFKSFKDFAMEFTPLTVIAGVNASGKSNLFDALQLLSDIADGELSNAFKNQRGDANDLFLQYSDGKYLNEMRFAMEMLVNKKVKDNWGGEADLEDTRLRYELKIARTEEVVYISYEQLTNLGQGNQLVFITTAYQEGYSSEQLMYQDAPYYQSQLSSALKVSENKYAFAARKEMRNWKIMQLNPDDIRKPTKRTGFAKYNLSNSGENLAGVLFQLAEEDKYFLVEISRKLNNFLPGYSQVDVKYNEITRLYHFVLKTFDGQTFSSELLSEGTLRLLVMCTMLYNPDQEGVLCFEEPENGVHPYIIRSMIELLKELCEPFNEFDERIPQVIVNTHSPIVVNEAVKWVDNRMVSVYFFRTDTLVTTIELNRVALRTTRSTPVYETIQSSSVYSEGEQKLTMFEVKKYLNSISS